MIYKICKLLIKYFKIQKCGQILCAHKPCVLMSSHIYVRVQSVTVAMMDINVCINTLTLHNETLQTLLYNEVIVNENCFLGVSFMYIETK